MSKKSRGFTLLEILLLVVGIISILAGIVIIAINPGRQLATVRNTERKSDLKQIYNASMQYYIDNEEYPATMPTSLTEICDTGNLRGPQVVIDCATESLIDLSLLVPDYMTAIPVDPSGASSTLTLITPAYAATGGAGYKIGVSSSSKLIASAPLAELDAVITVGTTTGTTTGGGGVCDATCLALRNGLVAYYPLDTNVDDYVGTNSANANGTISAEGRVNGGYDINRSYIDIPYQSYMDFGADNFTLSWWENRPSGSDQSASVSRGGATNMVWNYWNDDNGEYFFASDGVIPGDWNVGVINIGAWTYNTWNHFAVIRNGNNFTFYKNAEIAGTFSSDKAIGTNGTNSLRLGAYGAPPNGMVGIMDEFGVWNRALSPTEVSNLYNGGAGRSLIGN